jgi:hypothetical protein
MVNINYLGQKKTFVFRKNQPVQDISFWLINLLELYSSCLVILW